MKTVHHYVSKTSPASTSDNFRPGSLLNVLSKLLECHAHFIIAITSKLCASYQGHNVVCNLECCN